MASVPPEAAPARSGWRWLWLILVLVPLLLASAVPVGLWWLAETSGGRSFVARQVAGLEPNSGLRFEVGSIEGSLLSRFEMREVIVRDLDGILATIPLARIDWEPLTLVRNTVSINRLDIPELALLRMWRINPRDPDEPLLPDIDARIGRFEITRLRIEKPVFGTAETLFAAGRVDIRSGRLLLDMRATASRGDRLLLLLDAEPDRNRFDLGVDLQAPVGGLVTGLAGVEQPIALDISGSGSWAIWRGRVDADLGPTRVAALAIEADDGRFRLTGNLDAAPFVAGPVAALLQPLVAIDATASREGDLFDLRFVASTPALAVSGGGRIDNEEQLFQAFRAEAVLKQPRLLNPALSGTGLRAAVALEGEVRAPSIRWTAAADTLRFQGDAGPLGADALAASGSVRLARGTQPLAILFDASMQQTFGLPPEIAALMQAPRLAGTISFANGATRATGITLTTTSVRASGDATLLANGRASGTFDAALARYVVPQLGPVSVRAVARFDRLPGAAPFVDGRFEARSLGLANAAAAEFLGGSPATAGNFTLAKDGTILVQQARFDSPNLTFADARATYDPASGQFTLAAAGKSRPYGPVAIVASGTSAAPRATLKLASPGFGFGVRGLVADIAPAPRGFQIIATGDSAQGPLEGRVVLEIGDGRPLAADIERIAIAGLEASGRVVQTAAGPFAGTIAVTGTGLEAEMLLSAQGGLQRVDATARANGARIPLATPVQVAAGTARFAIVLVPDRPTIAGEFKLTGVRRDTLVLTSASGRADIAGNSGTARIDVAGKVADGQPFVTTASARSIAGGYAVGLNGSVGKLPLKLANPARIMRTAGGWELLPARIMLPSGQVDIAGQWGSDRQLRIVLTDVDMALANIFQPGLGLSGKASGQVNIRIDAGDRVPQGAANLTIAKLTRAGATGISIPVDVRLAATSGNDGLVLGARMAWQGNDLGRLVLRVGEGAGDDPVARLMAGRLSGGIRYNGPVDPLWALFGLEGQELKGSIAVGADFAGTAANPQLSGIARGRGIIYRNFALGTDITGINFDGAFTGPRLRITNLEGNAGGGTLKGGGDLNFALGDERSIDLRLDLKQARLANSDTLEFTLSGPITVKGEGTGATIAGDLRVDSARVQLVQMQSGEIPTLNVRRKGEIRVPEPERSFAATALQLDVRIRADDRVQVEGMGLDSVWQADLRVRGNARQPLIVGTANLARGEFSFAGSDFQITTGRVTFNGKPLDSSINIQAQTVTEDVTAFVTISGTATRPEVAFSSSPSLPEDEILARLLFGSSIADLSVTEAVQLATAIAGLQSGVDTMGKVRRSVGVDRLRLVGENSTTGMGAGLAIGKRITRNIYVEVVTDSQGNTLTNVQLTLSRIWSLFIEVSSAGDSSANLRFQREY